MEKIIIEVAGVDYKLKTLAELSIREYHAINEVLHNKKLSEVRKIMELLNLLGQIPIEVLKKVNLSSYEVIDWASIINITKEDKKIRKSYTIKDKEYKLVDYDDLVFGKFIDLEYFVREEDALEKVISILFLNDYTTDSLSEFSEVLKDEMKIVDATSIFESYALWRESMYKNYEELFGGEVPVEEKEEEEEVFEAPKEEEKEEEDSEGTYSAWLDTAYGLCNDNILNLDKILEKGIIEILNWLGYLRDKAEKEREIMKKTL